MLQLDFGRRIVDRLAARRCDTCLLAIVLAIAALAVTTHHADADLWGHVQYGRDALQQVGLPRTTTYSFTAEGFRWINHENLAELTYAIGMDWLGPVPMVVLKSLVGYGILALIYVHARRSGVGAAPASVVTLLVAINLTFHWSMRPQLFTYTLYALMLWLLTWCFDGWQGQWRLAFSARMRQQIELPNYSIRRLRFLWLTVPLLAIWTNAHGGFVAGFCLLAAYLGMRALEAWSLAGRRARGLIVRLGMMIVAAGLATLLNPYSFELHTWLIAALRRPWPEISEWHGPSFSDPMSRPWWLLLAAFAISIIATRRSRDFTHLGMLGLALWQCSQHQRHVPFFAIAFGLWMPVHVASVWQRVIPAHRSLDKLWAQRHGLRNASVAAGLVVLLALGVLIGRRMSDLTVPRDEYPVSALQYMADQHLQGNLVVTYDWAQYVIAAFGAAEPGQRGVRVAMDGRFNTCYPQDVIDMHFDFALGVDPPARRCRDEASGPFDPQRVLHFSRPPYGPPDLVLIARRQVRACQVMQQVQRDWVLLYRDATAELWGKACRYDNPCHADYLPPSARVADGGPQQGCVTWPALPVPTCKSSATARTINTEYKRTAKR